MWSGQTCGLFPLDTPLPTSPPSVWHMLPSLPPPSSLDVSLWVHMGIMIGDKVQVFPLSSGPWVGGASPILWFAQEEPGHRGGVRMRCSPSGLPKTPFLPEAAHGSGEQESHLSTSITWQRLACQGRGSLTHILGQRSLHLHPTGSATTLKVAL